MIARLILLSSSPVCTAGERGWMKCWAARHGSGHAEVFCRYHKGRRNTEAYEVLEACDKVELNIVGNGTHLAPWLLGTPSYSNTSYNPDVV
ncbi:hypothetical protein DFH94DRAFT_405522 [Russula ochroleuca]|uniref:Secreted protein n=1 Tax=Russula ochroleuca TaxID=152965 RepID=A0A9P5MY93_9AGAM|nr:hypothetical protein DFH94DRAFT_405522 [Russula ochroleuca]